MPQNCLGGGLLFHVECAQESCPYRLSRVPFIHDLMPDVQAVEKFHDFIQASPWKADVPRKVLGAGNNAGFIEEG